MGGMGLAVCGSYCYMTDSIYGFTIYDISNQSAPQVLMYLIPYGYGIDISGDYAYIASGHSGLHIFNISNPADISKAGYYYYGSKGQTERVKIKGNYAYIANGWGGLSILDISNPANPIEVGNFNSSYASGIAIRDNFLYLMTDGTQCLLRIIDISNPLTPTETSQLKLHGGFGLLRDVIVKNNYAYIAADSAGIYILDISDPKTPTKVGTLKIGGQAMQMAINGNYAYVADGSNGLRILDISDPKNPSEIQSFNKCSVRGITVDGNYAYILGNNGSPFTAPWELYILDIFDPYQAIEKGYFLGESSYSFVSVANQAVIIGNNAYVASTKGLYIIQNDLLTDIKNAKYQIDDYKLAQNYPNPFNPNTTIKFSVPSVETFHGTSLHVVLRVYDLLGREVTTLVDEEKAPGNYEVKFDVETLHVTSLPSGMYFYQLRTGTFSETKKMVYLK